MTTHHFRRHISLAGLCAALLASAGCFDAPLKNQAAPGARPALKAGKIEKVKLKASLALVATAAVEAVHSGVIKGVCAVPEGTVFNASSYIVMRLTADFVLAGPTVTVTDTYTFTPEILSDKGDGFVRYLTKGPVKAGAKPLVIGTFKTKISGDQLTFSASLTSKSVGDTSFFGSALYPYVYDYGQWLLQFTSPQTGTLELDVYASGYSATYSLTAPATMTLKKQKLTFKR